MSIIRVEASISTSATNRKGLTEHHSLGSRSLARVSHEATPDENVANAFVYVTKKAYPNYPDRLSEESERMLTEIAREERPDLDKTGLELACREIDQVDPYIRSRVWANVYPLKGSHFRMLMMGAEGNQLLKNTIRFQHSQWATLKRPIWRSNCGSRGSFELRSKGSLKISS
ncbi:hypothetical protein OROHE_003172 [Orobanche hederae]